MKEILKKDVGSKTLVEDILAGTLVDRQKTYQDLTSSQQEWADESFVWVSGQEQYIQLNEPLLVLAARDAYGDEWNPVKWILGRSSDLSAAQQGFDFEQVAARKVATALKDNVLRIKDDQGATLTVDMVPDEYTAITIKASKNFDLARFLQRPQTRTMFLPNNSDGPDVVFWVLCNGGQWYVVLIQAKYYQAAISGEKTGAAFDTVAKQLPGGCNAPALRIFFPFMGASYAANPALLVEHRMIGEDNYMYLDHKNAGAQVLGEHVCEALHRMKKKRKAAPA